MEDGCGAGPGGVAVHRGDGTQEAREGQSREGEEPSPSTGSAGGPGMLLWEPVWHRDRGQACTATPCPELLTQAKMGQHL